MKELENAIDEFIKSPGDQHFRDAAKKWAAYVLQHNEKEAIPLGLAIS